MGLLILDCVVARLVSKDNQTTGWSSERQFLYLNGRPVDLPKVGGFKCTYTRKVCVVPRLSL